MRRIRRISGWKNKREADMEDGRLGGRTWSTGLYFFGCMDHFLFHTITTTIRYAIVYLSAKDCVIIANLKYNEL